MPAHPLISSARRTSGPFRRAVLVGSALATFLGFAAAACSTGSGSGGGNGGGQPGDASRDTATPESDAASDGPTADADRADADKDAGPREAGVPLACSPIPKVQTIYYSRALTLPDGGPATDGELWMVSGDGSTDVKFAAGSHPRLSPDGKSLLYMRDNTPYFLGHLYMRALSGDGGAGTDTLIVSNNKGVVWYDWRADSSSIVFDNGADIFSANPDGTNLQTIITYRESDGYSDAPSVNKIDGRIAFHNFWDGLDLASSTGAGAAKIPNTFAGSTYPNGPAATEADMYPVWTPDGQWLAFLKIPPTDNWTPGDKGPLWKIKPDGTGLVRVFNFDPGDGFLAGSGAVSPDGTYYVSAGIYHGVPGIYAVPMDGSGTILHACTSDGPAPDSVGTVVASP